MAIVFHALVLAVRDMLHPSTLRLVLQSILLTLALLAFMVGGLLWAFRYILARYSAIDVAILDLASLLIALSLLASAWMMFRAVAVFVIGLFADSLIETVEKRHYPAAAAETTMIGFRQSFRLSLRSVMRFLGVNALALPLYLMLIPTVIGPPILALFVNAWLLGHDLESMVRARQASRPALPSPLRWSLGLLSAASLIVPIVNFLAPALSAAMAVHLFHLRPRGNI